MTTTRVDLAEVERRALDARRTGEDLSIAAGQWRDALASPISGCGPAGVAEALEGIREAWSREFKVYAQALEEWSRAAQAAAAAYAAADDNAAAALDAAGASAVELSGLDGERAGHADPSRGVDRW